MIVNRTIRYRFTGTSHKEFIMLEHSKASNPRSNHCRLKVKTTLFDLLGALSQLTPDDQLVVAAATRIINQGQARNGSSRGNKRLFIEFDHPKDIG